MKVENVNGTSGLTCGCGSWMNHWKNYNKGQIATRCRAAGCSNTDIVGAHVRKVTSGDNKQYIVPFCNTHNKQYTPKWIEVNSGTDLVRANKNATCK